VCHIGTPDKSGGRIWYEWQDKAGGYGIQTEFGRKAVKKIDGDYYNVVGLPVHRLARMLMEFGLELPMDQDIFVVDFDIIDK
jgi:hypothetical protein